MYIGLAAPRLPASRACSGAIQVNPSQTWMVPSSSWWSGEGVRRPKNISYPGQTRGSSVISNKKCMAWIMAMYSSEARTSSLTPSLPHSLTHSLTHSLSHFHTLTLSHSHTHTLSHSHTHRRDTDTSFYFNDAAVFARRLCLMQSQTLPPVSFWSRDSPHPTMTGGC
jgi:hypothetical protein